MTMDKHFYPAGIAVSVFFILTFLGGCSSTRYTYREIEKDKGTYNEQIFQAPALQLQKAVVGTLLSKKFVVDKDDPVVQTVSARRFFTRSHQTIVIIVQSKIMTIDEKADKQKLYLNAVQTTERNYIADRTRFLLWVVPLPGGGGKVVSNAKEAEMVIEDKDFYINLFAEIQKRL